MTALYKDGTVTLVQGSPLIVGNDTGWKVALIVGGTVFVEAEGGSPLPILPDDSDGANLHPITNTEMTAAIKWTGASGTYNYAIVRDMSYSRQQSANAEALAMLLQRLNNPSLAAVSGLVPEDDSLILFTGPDTATVIARASLVQGVDYDEDADDIAGRNLYSSEAKNFSVLVANAGDGRTAIFIKRSNTDGDWSVPFYISGPKGDKGDIGATGITDQGNYSAVATYVLGDAVLNNGSTWRAKGNVPAGNAPPVLPAEENAYWRLLARKGTDGNGTGDVKGPGAAVPGAIVQFATSDGKEVTTAQIGSRALLGRYSAGAGPVERLGQAEIRQIVGGWEYVRRVEIPANQSIINVNGLGAFVALRMVFSFICNANTGTGLQFSFDNGTTYRGDVDEYSYVFHQSNTSSPPAGGAGTAATFPLTGDHSGATGYPTVSEVLIHHFNTPNRNCGGIGHDYMQQSGGHQVREVGASAKRNEAYNAFRFVNISSTFQFGYIDIEGIRG